MRDMPGLTHEEAEHHLKTTTPDRPWLAPAKEASMDARRVIATVDQTEAHHLQRHEGTASGEAARARVERLHDPANPDRASRERSEDAFVSTGDGPSRHRCNTEATAIADPDAYATAVARVREHPQVQPVLDRPYDPTDRPRAAQVPIADLLGPHGHEACEGYRLEPVNASLGAAMQNRAEWVKARRDGESTDATEPRATKIDTFEGGSVRVIFTARADGSGYEILTMYPVPREEGTHGG